MTDKNELPTAHEAAEALASVERMRSAGLKRGLYPRGYAIAVALWCGALTTTAGLASAAFLPLLGLGLLGHWLWIRKTGIWVWVFRVWFSRRGQEIRSTRGLWTVLVLLIPVGGVMVAGYIGRQSYGLTWAPFVAGAIVAAVVFVLTEIAYRPVHRGLNAEGGS